MFHHPDKELKKKRKNYNDNSKSHHNKIEEKTTTGTARYRKYSLCSTVSKSPFWIRRSHLYVQEKKNTTHMEEWSSRCNNIYNPCLYPSICGQQMIWRGKNSKEKREREKMTNDRRNINLSPGRPCVSSSIPNVKLLQIQPGFLALWIGS